MNGTTMTLTELREAMTTYKAFLETGVRGAHTFYTDPRDGSGFIPAGEVECVSISGVHATQELRAHEIRLDKAVAAARAEPSLCQALDALPGGCYGFSTTDFTVNPPAIAESHRAQVKPFESWPWCEYVRADLLNALDRALKRLPSPAVQPTSGVHTDFPNPSAPMSKARAAKILGGDMTVPKLSSMMKSGTVRYVELNRETYIFDRDSLPTLPAT